MMYTSMQDTVLQKILQNADIVIPDGVGIFVGYQITGSGLPQWTRYLLLPLWCIKAVMHTTKFTKKYGERITGSRLTPDILAYALKNNIGITIIDPIVSGNTTSDSAKKQSQKTMKSSIEKHYPWIYCDVLITDTATKYTYQPIIFTTHGNGKQEKLLQKILQDNPSVILGVGVGSSIDLLTGFRTPAPLFFRRFGIEWLYRLYRNPKKHIRRMKNVLYFLKKCFEL